MRKYALLAAAAGLAISGIARADFVITGNTKATAGTGQLAGDDIYTIQVQNDGKNGSGNNMLAVDVTITADTASQGLIIRTWDGSEFSSGTPSSNTQADFGNRGTADENGNPRPGPSASYVKFNPFTYVASVPLENSQTYTDLGMVKQFEVVGLVNPPAGGADTAAKTLAQIVVPHGGTGTIHALLASENQTTDDITMHYGVPEPGSLSLLGLGIGGLLLRRRRA